MVIRFNTLRVILALIGCVCFSVPLVIVFNVWMAAQPPSEGLFSHMPVYDVSLPNITIRFRPVRRLKVKVTDSSQRMPIRHKSLAQMVIREVSQPSNPDADRIPVHEAKLSAF